MTNSEPSNSPAEQSTASSAAYAPARFAQIGGGPDAFIGAVHRMAARLDGRCELVAGAFSSDLDRSRQTGLELGLDSARISGDWNELLEREAGLRPSVRAEFVNIVTPNHLHAPIATKALELGFHVLSDKPLCHSLAQATQLQATHRDARSLGDASPPLFGVTYNYSGYPMVLEAQDIVRLGKIGSIRKVVVEYTQGWLAQSIEQDGQKQAEWRTDPQRAGAGGAMGDIGSHAAHLVEFVTGRSISRVCADLATSFEQRRLDDSGAVFLRLDDGTKGLLTATQIAIGRENGLRLHVYGSEGSLEWFQEEPNSLVLDTVGQPRQILRSGGPGTSEVATQATRLPAGHPEGFLEAFANLYRAFASAVCRRRTDPNVSSPGTPSLADGVAGMRFIEAVVASSERECWIDLAELELPAA